MYCDINRPLCLAEDTILSSWASQTTNNKNKRACQLPESLRGSKDSPWEQYLLSSAIINLSESLAFTAPYHGL